MPAGEATSGAMIKCHATREHETDARRYITRAERRCDHEAGTHPHKRPDNLGEPAFELSCGEREHGVRGCGRVS